MAAFALVAFANCLLGAALLHFLQTWVFRKHEHNAPDVPARGTAGDTAQKPPSSQHSAWLETLVERVECNIGRHAFELDELADELKAVPPDEPSSLMSVAAAMLIANRRLQADLAMAQAEILEQRQTVDALAAESRTDPLTGLANRRSFDEELVRRFDQWKRYKVPVALLMVDIDNFKRINDRYGHPVGDSALVWVAGIQLKAVRQMDVAARYGGEEFGIILPGTKLSDAANVAERLRATVAAKPYRDGDVELPVTVSVGLAVTLSGDDPANLVKRADEALYSAKRDGRNRAFLHNGSEAVAIQVDKGLVRHPFDTMQQVAIYHGGTGIPLANTFSPMRSSDISANGISLISESAPECKAFVVRLGEGDDVRYMVANVANITALSHDEPTQYRIGCVFVARLEVDDASDGETCERSADRQLASC
jgi:diguanylate cyclase (GGDEF)-like protein